MAQENTIYCVGRALKILVLARVQRVTINDMPCFVGKDVAEILGYSNSRKALTDHVDDEDKGVTKCDTLGGTQELTVISE